MNTQAAWPARFTRTIADQVKRIRTDRKLSAQQLSDACAKLGLEMPRSVIADLENGRRAHISVAELLVLASALDVPPLRLVFPVGVEKESEILPGETRAPFRGALWFTGERPFPGPDDGAYLDSIAADWAHSTGSPLELYRAHSAAVTRERRALLLASEYERTGQAADGEREAEAYATVAAARRQEAEQCRAAAANLRRRALELGYLAPELD
jgi:transcriptional regulator with XRE-family HTH domain